MKKAILFTLLLLIPFTAEADFAKSKIAVLDFKIQGSGFKTKDMGEIVAEWLITALVKEGRFDVIERRLLKKVLGEQKLGATGMSEEESASKLGKLLGVKVIISGSVIRFQDIIEVNARIIDVESASIITAESVKDTTAIGLEKLVRNMAEKIIKDFPLVGYVVHREGNFVTIDLGKRLGVKRKMQFVVFKEGKIIKHPITGEILDVENIETGIIEIVSVSTKIARAIIAREQSPNAILYGQRVKSTVEPVVKKVVQKQPLGAETGAAEKTIKDSPLEGYIVQRKEDFVVIDLGKPSGVKPKMQFVAFKEGEIIKHPVTKEILDVEIIETGIIEIVSVGAKIAKAIIVREQSPNAIGYSQRVKITVEPVVKKVTEKTPEAVETEVAAKEPEAEDTAVSSEIQDTVKKELSEEEKVVASISAEAAEKEPESVATEVTEKTPEVVKSEAIAKTPEAEDTAVSSKVQDTAKKELSEEEKAVASISAEKRNPRLFVKTKTENAKVRILNIKPKFQQGIELKKGPYNIEVSAPGYETKTIWITLDTDEDKTIKFRLTKKPQKEAPKLADSSPEAVEARLAKNPQSEASKFASLALQAAEPKIIAREGHFIKYETGVVKDTKTGLQWIAGPDKNVIWRQAKLWVDELDLDGGGWRLPEKSELSTIFQKGVGTRNMTPLLKMTGWFVWSGNTKRTSSSFLFEDWYGRANDSPYRGYRVFGVRSPKE